MKLVGLAILCSLATIADYLFRIPGPAPLIFLPWIGIGLTSLTILAVLVDVSRGAPPDDPIRGLLRVLERVDVALILLFIGHAAFLLVNGMWSDPTVITRSSDVLAKGGGQIDSRLMPWVDLRAWRDGQSSPRVLTYPWEAHTLWGGQPVTVSFREGLFKQAWILRIEPDDERRLRAILDAVPSAGQVRRRLVDHYIRDGRFNEAIFAGFDHLRIYPNDLAFAEHLAGALFNANLHPLAVPFLEPFLATRPTLEVRRNLGFALFRAGRKAEGATLMKQALEMHPDDVVSYYFLGYAYFYAGDTAGALPWFERLLEIEPNYPEIQDRVRAIRNATPPRPS
jgi:hypothetical protein